MAVNVLILSSHLRLGLPSFSLSFPHRNSVYAYPLSIRATWSYPSHSSWFYHPNNIG